MNDQPTPEQLAADMEAFDPHSPTAEAEMERIVGAAESGGGEHMKAVVEALAKIDPPGAPMPPTSPAVLADFGFRCGWRIQRHRDDQLPAYYYNEVVIRRGEWRMQMHAELFDDTTDEAFNEIVTRAYREFAFEHIQADLDTLAKQLLREIQSADGWDVPGVPYAVPEEVTAALRRWEKMRRDMQEET